MTTPLEELSEEGQGTGLEAEARLPGDEAQIVQPFDPDKIEVITRNPTIDLIISRIRSGAIDLEPDFQRRPGIWDGVRRSRLIESLLLRIPLPTLYAAEDEHENWAIVDGIQRLTSIVQFVSPGLIREDPLRLQRLEYLGAQYNGSTYDDLPPKLQLRIRETELVLHVIKKGTPEAVKFNIFARINTGGLPLSAQELRNALVSGPIRERLRHLAESPEFSRATMGSIRDTRMADREMVLRFVAFLAIDPSRYDEQDFDQFLRAAMARHNVMGNDEWSKIDRTFRRSMLSASAIFAQHAFRKFYALDGARSPINKALFEAVSVSLAKMSGSEVNALRHAHREVQNRFIRAFITDSEFVSAISSGTGDIRKVRLRFRRVDQLLRESL